MTLCPALVQSNHMYAGDDALSYKKAFGISHSLGCTRSCDGNSPDSVRIPAWLATRPNRLRARLSMLAAAPACLTALVAGPRVQGARPPGCACLLRLPA